MTVDATVLQSKASELKGTACKTSEKHHSYPLVGCAITANKMAIVNDHRSKRKPAMWLRLALDWRCQVRASLVTPIRCTLSVCFSVPPHLELPSCLRFGRSIPQQTSIRHCQGRSTRFLVHHCYAQHIDPSTAHSPLKIERPSIFQPPPATIGHLRHTPYDLSVFDIRSITSYASDFLPRPRLSLQSIPIN